MKFMFFLHETLHETFMEESVFPLYQHDRRGVDEIQLLLQSST